MQGEFGRRESTGGFWEQNSTPKTPTKLQDGINLQYWIAVFMKAIIEPFTNSQRTRLRHLRPARALWTTSRFRGVDLPCPVKQDSPSNEQVRHYHQPDPVGRVQCIQGDNWSVVCIQEERETIGLELFIRAMLLEMSLKFSSPAFWTMSPAGGSVIEKSMNNNGKVWPVSGFPSRRPLGLPQWSIIRSCLTSISMSPPSHNLGQYAVGQATRLLGHKYRQLLSSVL